MIPVKINTISPFLKDKTRLIYLSGKSQFGKETDDEHIMNRMNNFIENLDNEYIFRLYEDNKIRDFPDLERHEITKPNLVSDILLKDVFRQHHGIEERFRKKLVCLNDLRRIGEPATKFHISISRGYERHLVDFINKLDNEFINRKQIKPLLL